MLGVNLSGAEFGKSHRYGYDYIYPSEADIAAYAARGAELIRLPFKWERMQTDLGGSLNGAELGRLKTFLDAAERQGVEVVLDLHNYGRYGDKVLGTAELPKQVFADFWAKLAANVGSHKAIYGYGLMNEPHDLGSDTVWPEAAQAAVNAIRAIDKTNTIIVGGDAWSSANMWKAANQKLNIYDSADNILYEAHVYFDNDGSGVYNEGYDAEGAYPNIGVDRLKNFVEWLDERGARGFIGEFAVPDTDPRWAPVLDNFLAAIESVGLDATYWGAGPWFGDYSLGLMKKDGTERPQLDVLEKYFGTAQGQVIDGSAGSETIVGGRGDDIIYARGGDDVVLPSLGADWIDGGLGSDTVSYQHDFYGVDVDLRRDVQFGGNAAGDRLRGVENLIGTGASDRLAGDDGANVLKGLGGVDWLQGGAGADTLDGGDGEDTVSYADSAAGVRVDLGKAVQAGGSAEGDRLIAIENVIGSRFDDLLAGNAGNNKLSGGAGNDRFLAVAGGSDVIDGGSGYDIYDASMSTVSVKLNLQAGGNKWLRLSSIEELRGGSAIDELRGDGGANRLVGNAGNDLLDGAGGADVMDGGMGNDSYWVDNTADKVIERPGEGTDIVHASASFVLPANVEKMILVGSAAINGTGNALGNRIEGNSASNVLLGMDGADYLFGGAGGDRLDGGAGMDRLTGGAGADWLIGGLDADRFIFSNADLGSGQDTIADFSRSQGDLIDLWGIDADAGLVGDQRFIYVGQAMFSRQAGELRTVSLDGGVQVQGDINGDGLADFSLMVQWVDSLAARDFIL